MDRLEQAVVAYVEKEGFLPGENLGDLKDALVKQGLLLDAYTLGSDERLAQALTSLVRKGKLKLHIRKGQFLHIHPFFG